MNGWRRGRRRLSTAILPSTTVRTPRLARGIQRVKQRRRRVGKNGATEVRIESLNGSASEPDTVEVSFDQACNSDNYRDRVAEIQVCRRIGGQWLIVRERVPRFACIRRRPGDSRLSDAPVDRPVIRQVPAATAPTFSRRPPRRRSSSHCRRAPSTAAAPRLNAHPAVPRRRSRQASPGHRARREPTPP
jgi:hypothetical protein